MTGVYRPRRPNGYSRPTAPRPGPTNTLTDVAGLRVGHHGRIGDGWLTGTTVVLAPPAGAVAGVDVRGGGPGTHETDLLDPRNLIERVHAIVLGGGSAFGLAAVTGVVERLADAGIGFEVGGPGEVVPIVPAAVLFDLGRGGAFRTTPDAGFGAAAYDAASDGPVEQGTVGAGTGAVAGADPMAGGGTGVGGMKGGVGSASAVLAGGATVAALVVVNAAGSAVDPRTGALYGARFGLEGEFGGLRDPDPVELTAVLDAADRIAEAARAAIAAMSAGVRADPQPTPEAVLCPMSGMDARPGAGGMPEPFHTTIGVVATDATLTKAQCQKLAGVAHDGMARALRPVHTMFDGDTVFGLATCDGDAPDPPAFNELLSAGADAFSRAVVHAMLAAIGAGGFRAYGEMFPSAMSRWRRP